MGSIVVKRKKLEQSNKELKKKVYTQHTSLDKKLAKKFEKYYKIAKKIEDLTNKISELEDQMAEIAPDLVEALEQVTDRTIQVNELLVYLQDRRVQVKRPRYKDAVEFLLPRISDELREAVQEFLKAEYELRTYLKHKKVESFLGDVISKAKGIWQKIRKYVSSIFKRIKRLDSYIAELKKIAYTSEAREFLQAYFEALNLPWLSKIDPDYIIVSKDSSSVLVQFPSIGLRGITAFISKEGSDKYVAQVANGLYSDLKDFPELDTESVEFSNYKEFYEFLYDFIV